MSRTPAGKNLQFLLFWAMVAWGLVLGCADSRPLGPKEAAFRQQVHKILDRLAGPLAEPVAREDKKVIQGILLKLFSLCAADCEGVLDNVVVLDRDGVTIAVYPPEKVPVWNFSDYTAVKRAVETRKPAQTLLYRPEGTVVSAICAPLVHQGRVEGVVVLVIESKKLQEKMGLSEKEFLSLDLSRS